MSEPVYKLLKTLNGYFVYDRSMNSIIRLNHNDYDEIVEAENNNRFKETNVYKKLRSNGYFKDNILETIEHPCTNFTKHILENHIEQLTLQVTQRCNLRCKYCVYSGIYDDRNRTHGDYDMSLDTAIKAINFYLSKTSESDSYTFGFYGGEPLLKFDLIEKCVNYINDNAKDKNVNYTITTNGTLINNKIITFLAKNNFSIVISMDGSKEDHNINRVFKNGEGSYDKIISNLKMIKENHPEIFKTIRFNTVLNPNQNFPSLKTYFEEDDLLGNSMVMMQLVDNKSSDRVLFSDEFYRATAYDRFKLYLYMLNRIEEKNVSKLVLADYFFIKEQYSMISSGYALPNKCHHGGPCIPGAKRLFVNVYEKLYPCERVGENSEVMIIGDLDKGFDYKKVNRLLNVGKLTSTECKKCWALHYCGICCKKADGKDELSREEKLSYCAESKKSAYFQLAEICALKDLGCCFDKEETVI